MNVETPPFHLDRINDMIAGDAGNKAHALRGRALFPSMLVKAVDALYRFCSV